MSIHAVRLLWTLGMLLTLLVVGTVGYVVIEGQPLTDAIYMTVITVTAVGYEEVWPLTPRGQNFTMVILLGGITWMGLWFATITAFIVELDLKGVLGRRRAMQAIADMQGHVVVCGAGRTGRQVARELASSRHPFVVIERDPKRVEQLREYAPDAHVVQGDATHDHVLLEAGLPKSTGLIACLSADTDNLYLSLSARKLAEGLTIVARAYEEESIEKLYRAGADHVVSPNVSSAIRMVSVVRRPSGTSFTDLASRASEMALHLEELRVGRSCGLVGLELGQARLPQQTGLLVIALGKHSDHGTEFVFNPSASTRIEAGDDVVVLGRTEQIEKLRTFLA